jgi:hypothetical protein
LQNEYEHEGDKKRQHAPEGLILKDVKPAIGVVEGIEEMVQHAREIL